MTWRPQPVGSISRADSAAPTREPLDLRLAVGAVGAWIAVIFCADAGAGTVLAWSMVAFSGGIALLAVGRRRPGLLSAAALVAFCVALVLLPLAGRIEHARSSPLAVLAREHAAVTVELTVSADPRVLAATGPAGVPRVGVETSADVVLAHGVREPVDGDIFVLGNAAGWRDLLPGQRVLLDGNLQPDLNGGTLSVTLFARAPPARLGEPPWWQQLAGTVRSALRRAASGLPSDVRGLLPGLVDGDTTALDPVLANRFKLAGLTHLVAVSGTNCSLVVGAVLLVLRRMRARPWVCALVGALVLLTFVLVARPSPSVLRAALMSVVALASLASGRPRAAVPSLSAVVLALLLWDPTLAGSASFAMSVLATAALILIAPGWARALRDRRVPIGLAESVAVAAAAHLVTAPVVAAISGRVSLVAIFANVLAEPVVAITTVAGFGAAVVAPLWLPAGVALAWIAGWPCRWLVAVANFFGGLHGATIPWPGGVAGGLALLLVLAVVGAAAIRAGPRRALAASAVTALVILIPVRSVTSGWPPGGWVFAACDVGQGDALLLRAGPGSAVVIDAGPDPISIDRCLRDFGVTSIPLLIITHFHLDHVGGLPGVVHGRTVGSILTGPLDEPASGFAIVRHSGAAVGRQVRTPAVRTHLDVGAVHLDVLGPASAFHGTRSDPNNSSLEVRAQVHGVRIMLPGDMEVESQRALFDSHVDLRADVLKVPHHGSAYSDPDFLAAVHASVGVISVGLHNDYGHPSPVLLHEMAQLGVPVRRTDLDGDVAVVSHDGRVGTVVHGVRASTVGLRLGPGYSGLVSAGETSRPAREPAQAAAAWPGRSSGRDARMRSCPHVRSPSTTCRLRCRASCSSSATRNCLSTVPSARSPPPRGGPTLTS